MTLKNAAAGLPHGMTEAQHRRYAWLEKAAAQDYPPAVWLVGVRLKYGLHVPRPPNWNGPVLWRISTVTTLCMPGKCSTRSGTRNLQPK
jgi:hypothetical protein